MPSDPFVVLAEPNRRRILGELCRRDHSVNELVVSLALTQSAVSKHLAVLRAGGFVSCRTAAQRRVYRVERARFDELDAWLLPYRQLWNRHLDALERHLDGDTSRPSDSQERS